MDSVVAGCLPSRSTVAPVQAVPGGRPLTFALMGQPEPFRVDVPHDTLENLAERLRRTRLPNEIAGIG